MPPTLEKLDIKSLDTSERLELIGLLWDSITDADPRASIPEWHLREIASRRAAAVANPSAGTEWEIVKARLIGQE
jgi:putative addiction module component (TIGR02574 family)